MEIPILIEPVEGGRCLARAGEPFAVSVEAGNAEEALRQLEILLRQRLKNGFQLATIHLDNGPIQPGQPPLQLEPVPDDDWFFQTMEEAIAENRRLEDEASS